MGEKNTNADHSSNTKDRQGVDQDPAEEKKTGQQVTPQDLKGKKVDADPGKKEDQPIDTGD